MDKQEVVALLGEPQDLGFANGEEQWTYRHYDYLYNLERVKIITFKGGKCVSLKNDEMAEQRSHEIARARAAATRVNITAPQGLNGPLECSKWNAYGKYPPGGGCNAYGCWPAGGECSAFGCSASSHCGAANCPDRIGRLPCE